MIKFLVFGGVMLLVLFLVWRTADMQKQMLRQESEYWKAYAQQLEQQAKKERESKRVETDIEQLSNDGVVKRMCEQGYLSDCSE